MRSFVGWLLAGAALLYWASRPVEVPESVMRRMVEEGRTLDRSE